VVTSPYVELLDAIEAKLRDMESACTKERQRQCQCHDNLDDLLGRSLKVVALCRKGHDDPNWEPPDGAVLLARALGIPT
jgi:hypothetical protein